jgi:hypothetical protein
MLKNVIVLCAVIAAGVAEKSGPYPPKGWKPQGERLELPREYGTPRPGEVEFTTLTNEYLPPTTTEVSADEDDAALRVQGLPAVDSVTQFRKFQRRRPSNVRARPQLGRIQMAPAPAFANQPFLLASLFAPQFAPANQQLKERPFGRLEQTPEVNDPKNDVQQLPARAYGPPRDEPEKENDEPELPQNEEPEQPQNEEPENEEEQPQNEDQPQNEEQPQNDNESDEDDDEGSEPTIAVANAESNGNLVRGQYYLLLPDQSLQKVRFATKQTDEDRQINGFSAQLR